MDPVRNPFAPGAGTQPPELAGRDGILEEADIALQRAVQGRSARSQILLGLRGVGKTVLLNKIEQIAEGHGYLTSMIEAPEHGPLAELVFPKIHETIRKLSMLEGAKATAHAAMRALRSFAGAFKITYGEASISVDPEAGTADSGDIENDLPELFMRIGLAARDAGRAWTLLIDEMQYLSQRDLAALIVAMHKVNQRGLPILFFGAGLPQVAKLSGDAKSYAERLFAYPEVGPLDAVSAKRAVREPIESEAESIDPAALHELTEKTRGYPYFIQEWAYQAWSVAQASPISIEDVAKAGVLALKRLDAGFFKVRLDRLTPVERDYVTAMAKLGKGPYRSSDVAMKLERDPTSLGPTRAKIIEKGMIYSPSYGEIAFTVPLFEEFLARHHL